MQQRKSLFFFFLNSILACRNKAYGEVMGKPLIRPKTRPLCRYICSTKETPRTTTKLISGPPAVCDHRVPLPRHLDSSLRSQEDFVLKVHNHQGGCLTLPASLIEEPSDSNHSPHNPSNTVGYAIYLPVSGSSVNDDCLSHNPVSHSFTSLVLIFKCSTNGNPVGNLQTP